MVKGSDAEMGGQAKTSLGRGHKGVDQIHDLPLLSQHVLQKRLLVLRLEPLQSFVPYDVVTLPALTLTLSFAARRHFHTPYPLPSL